MLIAREGRKNQHKTVEKPLEYLPLQQERGGQSQRQNPGCDRTHHQAAREKIPRRRNKQSRHDQRGKGHPRRRGQERPRQREEKQRQHCRRAQSERNAAPRSQRGQELADCHKPRAQQEQSEKCRIGGGKVHRPVQREQQRVQAQHADRNRRGAHQRKVPAQHRRQSADRQGAEQAVGAVPAVTRHAVRAQQRDCRNQRVLRKMHRVHDVGGSAVKIVVGDGDAGHDQHQRRIAPSAQSAEAGAQLPSEYGSHASPSFVRDANSSSADCSSASMDSSV